MIELELLGANGDRIVMTGPDGERYTIVVDDALRGAVRRARPTALTPDPQPVRTTGSVRPRDLQALMRAGATADEAAQATGADIEQVRRFEGPVLAERAWAVEQARACRIGWQKDSPVLGDLVIDRLATRAVEPGSLSWDALRHGREPWQIVLSFVQGAEEKRARWELDVSARSVTALDDEARWLTESASRRAEVFDQDEAIHTVSALPPSPLHSPASVGSAPLAAPDRLPGGDVTETERLLADLALNRGVRVDSPSSADFLDDDELAEPGAEPPALTAPVVSMSARAEERRRQMTGHHPAGSRLPAEPAAGPDGGSAPSAPPAAPTGAVPAQPSQPQASPQAPLTGEQDALPDMPDAPASPRSKRRTRRSVPSWDEIVFGAKPE